MSEYTYQPKGVCSQQIDFSIDEQGMLHDVRFKGGCNGNLKAIGKLVEGMSAEKAADILRGNQCGFRSTSCADQFSCAIDKALGKNA